MSACACVCVHMCVWQWRCGGVCGGGGCMPDAGSSEGPRLLKSGCSSW